MTVEEMLSSLADQDEVVNVPESVGRAVLAAWDARDAERQRHTRVWDRSRARTVAVAALVAVVVAIVYVAELRIASERAVPRWRRLAVPSAAVVPVVAPSAQAEAPATAVPVVQPRAVKRPSLPTVSQRTAAATYVLVPDTDLDAPMTMVRVRMMRSAFSRLGVPIANPDGEGMVDVEMLVGEDGVARSIRRATAVSSVDGADQGN